MFFVIFLIIGAFSGTIAGLLGLGGGIIIVPALAAVFSHYKLVPPQHVMHVAIATSLTTVIISFLSSMRAHMQHGSVHWEYLRLLLPFIVVGIAVGFIVAKSLDSDYLRIIFSLFVFFMAYRLLMPNPNANLKNLPSKPIIYFVSFLVGFLSTILGVGGGVILVPFLLRFKLSMQAATGTTVACGVVIGFLASLSYLLGAPDLHLPWSTGYIYWPAFVGVAITSMLFAPVGTAIAYKLQSNSLKKILALFLIIVGIHMLIPQ